MYFYTNFDLESFHCKDGQVADVRVCTAKSISAVHNSEECKTKCENQQTCKAFDFDGRSTCYRYSIKCTTFLKRLDAKYCDKSE